MKKYILLCLSKACNLDCIGCTGEKTGKLATVDDIPTIIESLLRIDKEFGIDKIVLHGAETFMLDVDTLDEILTAIRRTFGVKLPMGCQSNGTLITDEKLDVMRRHNVSVSVSYRGYRELFKKLTRRENDELYDRFVEGCKKVKEYMGGNLNSIFYYPTELENEVFENYKKLIDTAVELGITSLMLNEYASSNPNKHYADFVIKCQEYVIQKQYSITLDPIYAIIRTIHGKGSLDCSWRHDCLRFIAIDPDGSTYICNRHVENYTPSHEECRSCPIYIWCNGGCEHTRILNNGKFPYCNDRIKLFQYCLRHRKKLATWYFMRRKL